MESQTPIQRNLFEVDNARALAPFEVANTFVPTQTFWRLLSPENHIVVGARGSGKTALAKMLSHEHLALLDNDGARSIIIHKSLIGVYIPTRLEWVGALRNKPWHSDQEHEEFFSWRLNIASCLAFLRTVRSCLDTYFQGVKERALAEVDLVESLCDAWIADQNPATTQINSVQGLQRYLRRVEYIRQRNYAMARVQGADIFDMPEGHLGSEFAADLFSPLQYGTRRLGELIALPDEGRFMIILDEAEFLNEFEQRILNSFFRTHGDISVFKMTTMPYKHLTLETNTAEDLRERHDFEYIYIDQDPVVEAGNDDESDSGRGWERFADHVFTKRAETSGKRFSGLRLHSLLGRSILLDPRPGDWLDGGHLRQLVEKHCDEDTVNRAQAALREVERPIDPDQRDKAFGAFSNAIGRKLRGALLLREAVAEQRGAAKLDIYSGVSMIVRCADGNPRALITIFNAMLRRGGWRGDRGSWEKRRPMIEPTRQTDILISVSDRELMKTQAVREVGAELHSFIDEIGNAFRRGLHDEKLSTDTYLSIDVDPSTPTFKRYEKLISAAISYGLFRVPRSDMRDALATTGGRFRLAYILSPHFRLLPRQGRSRPLERILSAQARFNFGG
jgi:hypothetical protein